MTNLDSNDACCHHCHTSIDALKELMKVEGFGAGQVERIEIRHPSVAHYLIGEPLERKQNPKTLLDAQMSLPYCMAVTLTYGHVGVHQFDENHRSNKLVYELMQKVTPIIDLYLEKEFSAEKWPAIVTVTLRGGKILSKRWDHPKGSPEHPMSEEDFLRKLREQAQRSLKPQHVERLVDGFQNIEKASDVAVILSNLDKKGD